MVRVSLATFSLFSHLWEDRKKDKEHSQTKNRNLPFLCFLDWILSFHQGIFLSSKLKSSSWPSNHLLEPSSSILDRNRNGFGFAGFGSQASQAFWSPNLECPKPSPGSSQTRKRRRWSNPIATNTQTKRIMKWNDWKKKGKETTNL